MATGIMQFNRILDSTKENDIIWAETPLKTDIWLENTFDAKNLKPDILNIMMQCIKPYMHQFIKGNGAVNLFKPIFFEEDITVDIKASLGKTEEGRSLYNHEKRLFTSKASQVTNYIDNHHSKYYFDMDTAISVEQEAPWDKIILENKPFVLDVWIPCNVYYSEDYTSNDYSFKLFNRKDSFKWLNTKLVKVFQEEEMKGWSDKFFIKGIIYIPHNLN